LPTENAIDTGRNMNKSTVNIGQTVTANDVNFVVMRVQESCFDEPPTLHCKRILKKTKKPGKKMYVLDNYEVCQ
jgi:preprotein translocase subunit Sss1